MAAKRRKLLANLCAAVAGTGRPRARALPLTPSAEASSMIARTRCQRILAALILSLLPAPACATATDGRLLFAAIFTSLGSGAVLCYRINATKANGDASR